jgi:small multidrug resistance pump
MQYLNLSTAILLEVTATSALKAADSFANLAPSIIVIIGYGGAFYFLSFALRTIPDGIAYAIWSRVGIVLTGLAGLVFYKQTLDLAAILSMALILAGVGVPNVFSKSVPH